MSAVADLRDGSRPFEGRWGVAALARVALGVILASALVLITIVRLKSTGGFLFDFKGDLYGAGRAILHGQDPYHPSYLATLAARVHAGATVSPTFASPVYPAPSLVAAVPFAVLPFLPSGLLFLALMVAAMICGLRLLGVDDWRCIAVALVSWPFVFGLDLGAVGPVLVLGAGVAWRFRHRTWPPATAIASVVVAKLFPWTLLVWLCVTRRFRVLALTLAIFAVAVLGAWAIIGFASLTAYPRMLADLSVVEQRAGVSLVSALMVSGVSSALAELLAFAVASALLTAAYHVARRPEGDAQALSLAVIAALIASPIVWPHYFVLLYVPIALMSPRLTAWWFAPLVPMVVSAPTADTLIQILPWLLLVVAVTTLAFRPPTRDRERSVGLGVTA
jgi:glycosyl transferase family 87